MSVLFLTIFVSMMLVLFFVGAFLYHHDFSGGDPLRDSLLPFGKEKVGKGGAERSRQDEGGLKKVRDGGKKDL